MSEERSLVMNLRVGVVPAPQWVLPFWLETMVQRAVCQDRVCGLAPGGNPLSGIPDVANQCKKHLAAFQLLP